MKCHAKDGECSDRGEARYRIKCDDLTTNVCDHHFDVHFRHAKKFELIKEFK